MTDNINPGKELQNFLTELYSLQSGNFLQKIDDDLMSGGELYELFYTSCINYLVRRFITTAEYFRRKYDPEDFGDKHYRDKLREYLRDYTNYRDKFIDRLVLLLDRCLTTSDDEPTDHVKARLKRKAREAGQFCFVCGEELDYTNSNPKLSATVDHIWPRSMGGGSHTDNLQVACQRCNNNIKKDFIDASDYHYEEISLVSPSYDEYIRRERNRSYEVAIFAKTQFTCAGCGQPAHRVGKLQIGRKEPGDSWHFLNLVAYCSNCSEDKLDE